MTMTIPDDSTLAVIVLCVVVLYTYLGGAIGYAVGYRHGQRSEVEKK